jgi:hypothetical protein
LSPAEPTELESILRGFGSQRGVSLARYLA